MIKEIGSAQKPSFCSKNQDGIIAVGKKVQELKISHSGRSTDQSDKRNWKKIVGGKTLKLSTATKF